MGSVANKRISRLEKNEMETPAYNAIMCNGGHISVKGKNLNQVRAEYARVSAFLKAKTSTVKGAKKVKKEFEVRIGGALKPSEMKDFWSAYHKLEELEPAFLRAYGSDKMQKYLHDEIVNNGMTADDLLKAGIDKINEDYKQKIESESDEIDQFFDIGFGGTSGKNM